MLEKCYIRKCIFCFTTLQLNKRNQTIFCWKTWQIIRWEIERGLLSAEHPEGTFAHCLIKVSQISAPPLSHHWYCVGKVKLYFREDKYLSKYFKDILKRNTPFQDWAIGGCVIKASQISNSLSLLNNVLRLIRRMTQKVQKLSMQCLTSKSMLIVKHKS